MGDTFSYARLLEAGREQHAGHRPTTLLVGTALSVGQLHHALEVIDPRPTVVGCLLDADPEALRHAEPPCPVIGAPADLDAVLDDRPVEQVLISLPMSRGERCRDLTAACDRRGIRWRFMPTLSDQLAGRVLPRHLGRASDRAATIDVAQLIDRQPQPLDTTAIAGCLADRCVLVTGAGGSIGSEIARIVARFSPAKIVLVERSENALFEIDREMASRFPAIARVAELHDVTHAPATHRLIERHRPHVIFHAAAHKHVPMMEDHPSAAVENNLFGTRAIADAADAHGVERFVMISTDKAVNPSSVMGATKRLAELYVQHLGVTSRTIFSMVRFGNVLGSACSVLPIWADQLARGGPITVTHPQMSRYFMTIPEAAGLVLQAGAQATRSATGGTVFLLDMGKPVRIVDLAHRFLRMQGYEPGVDVAIEFTGVRPGEKLFEELAYDSEDMLATPHAGIRVWRTTPPDPAHVRQVLATFERLRAKPDASGGDHPWAGVTRDAILNALRAAVPEMVAAAAG
jgi:FlaA1/EpsC-like NDP-sugar epimerase